MMKEDKKEKVDFAKKKKSAELERRRKREELLRISKQKETKKRMFKMLALKKS